MNIYKNISEKYFCEKRVAFRSYKRVLRSHSIATTFEKSEIVQVNMEF